MKLESYWLDTAPPFAHAARGALEGREAIPGHFGPPWFLPRVGACYQALDRIH
jgi:hypothetical protein